MSRTVKRLLCSVVLATSFVGILVFAGHGVGAIGMLLVLGRAPEYVFPVVAGWLDLGLLAVSSALPSHGRRLAGISPWPQSACCGWGFCALRSGRRSPSSPRSR